MYQGLSNFQLCSLEFLWMYALNVGTYTYSRIWRPCILYLMHNTFFQYFKISACTTAYRTFCFNISTAHFFFLYQNFHQLEILFKLHNLLNILCVFPSITSLFWRTVQLPARTVLLLSHTALLVSHTVLRIAYCTAYRIPYCSCHISYCSCRILYSYIMTAPSVSISRHNFEGCR
jgi:hypothetical protein